MTVVTTGPWEDRLMLDWVAVIRPPTAEFLAKAQPHQKGFIGLWPREDDGDPYVIMARADLTPEQREAFARWCQERIARFVEHGPEPDGWTPRSDGGWQLYAAERWLPGF